MAFMLLLLAIIVQTWVASADYSYSNWSTCTVINWQSVCTFSICEVTTTEVKKVVPLDVSAIIAKLSETEQLALAQYYQAQVGCNSYPMTTTTDYVNDTKCTETTDSFCWDNILDSNEECDWQYYCNSQCEIVRQETFVEPVQPTYNYDIIAPTGWTNDESLKELYSKRF